MTMIAYAFLLHLWLKQQDGKKRSMGRRLNRHGPPTPGHRNDARTAKNAFTEKQGE